MLLVLNSNVLYAILGKSHKLPFTSKYVKAMQSFDLVYVNLWTSPVIYVTSVKYYLLFVDDYLRYMWVYLLSQKRQCKISFQMFFNLVEKTY